MDNREDALRELTAALHSGDASGVRDWLQEFSEESEPGEAAKKQPSCWIAWISWCQWLNRNSWPSRNLTPTL